IEQNLIDIQFPDAPGLRLYSTEREEWAKQLFQTTGSNLFVGHFANLDIFSGAFSDESEIFEKAGLSYIPPALREDAASISRFIEREAAPLITVADIKGIIHSHSTWSDGRNTIAEMAIAA